MPATATRPSRRSPATARIIVLAEPGDERIGEWLIDGCSVLPAVHRARRSPPRPGSLAGLVATPPAFAADALRYERVGERRSVPPGFDALTPRSRCWSR
jgi:hypothetical protein